MIDWDKVEINSLIAARYPDQPGVWVFEYIGLNDIGNPQSSKWIYSKSGVEETGGSFGRHGKFYLLDIDVNDFTAIIPMVREDYPELFI